MSTSLVDGALKRIRLWDRYTLYNSAFLRERCNIENIIARPFAIFIDSVVIQCFVY